MPNSAHPLYFENSSHEHRVHNAPISTSFSLCDDIQSITRLDIGKGLNRLKNASAKFYRSTGRFHTWKVICGTQKSVMRKDVAIFDRS